MNESINYYQKYNGIYITTETNISIIPITLNSTTYRSDLDILDVYINGFKLNSSEYSINGNNIELVNAIDVVGTKIEFVALRSVVTTMSYEQLKGDTGSATTIKRWAGVD